MYEKVLGQSFLTKEQAVVYSALLKAGAMPAGKLSQKTPLKRGLVYKILEQLTEMDLVRKQEKKGKVTTFSPNHPSKLKELAKTRHQQTKEIQTVLDSIMPTMISDFNLAEGKPYVRFAEGKKGIIEIYEELLDERSPIDSIEDKGEMAQFIPEYFPKFIKKRVKRQIFNRVVCPASNPINKTSKKEFRETRSIPVKKYPLSMDIKITGNKVSLITLKKGSAVGILIEHPEISKNFKLIFKYLWDSLEKN